MGGDQSVEIMAIERGCDLKNRIQHAPRLVV